MGTYRSEDGIGLVAAIALHALLIAVLAAQFLFTANQAPSPQRMTVSLASEVSLESTAPAIVEEARAAIAPELAEEPAPPIEEAPAEPVEAETSPPPQAQTPPRPRPQARTPQPETPARRRPEPARETPAPRPQQRPGGSRIGDNFLQGQGDSTASDDTRIPASQIGRRERASIIQALSRQLKPYWDAPSGLDAEQLVTVLSFRLNEDGSLAGRPRVVRQSGITNSNRPQAPLHAERAIRAVQRAAPFDLPDEYYNVWKSINGASFDRNLSR